jgi:hypothetical protein
MSHFTSLLPAMPGPRPSAALYSGPRESPMLARPTWPPSPAGHCVCVCVLGVCCVLCRSICFVLSGRLSFGIRLLLHSVVLSVAVLPFSGSVLIAHAVRCAPSRIRLRCAVSCFRVGCRSISGCFCILLFCQLLYFRSRVRFRLLMQFVARPAAFVYAVLLALCCSDLPVTHCCAYASLGWYTLCSIPGMHSSALSSPTHIYPKL